MIRTNKGNVGIKVLIAILVVVIVIAGVLLVMKIIKDKEVAKGKENEVISLGQKRILKFTMVRNDLLQL